MINDRLIDAGGVQIATRDFGGVPSRHSTFPARARYFPPAGTVTPGAFSA